MQRILSLDLARGFTVFIMPSVHVVMLYSNASVQQSILVDILAFLAEGPGAQLFMLLMGAYFTFSTTINKQTVFKRAFYLLILAYVLNFLKFILPLLLGWVPENFLQELQLQNDTSAVPFFLLLGDILHFAAIAYLLLYLVYQLKHYQYWSLVFAIAIMLLSPLVWDVKTGFIFVDYLLQLLGGHPPYVFFPVFPWLVYPLFGLTLGFLLKQYQVTEVLYKIGKLGIVLLVISCMFPATKSQGEWPIFYRTEFPDTIFHLGFVLAWLGIVHWISSKATSNWFFSLLTFCSRNITSIYIIQWALIFWSMGLTGYLTLNFTSTFLIMAAISVLTFLLVWLANHIYGKKDL